MEIGSLVTAFVASLVVVLKKFNVLPAEYDALISAVGAVLAQLATVIVAQNAQLSQPLTLILNILVAVLGAVGATIIGRPVTQAKAAYTSYKLNKENN